MDSPRQALVAETPPSGRRIGSGGNDRGPLVSAALPVVDQLVGDLAGTGIGVRLSDARGQIVHRHVGEISLDGRAREVGAAAPITDPRSGRTVGTLTLVCCAADRNPLMRPLAARAARDVEQRLVDESGVAERLALGRFLEHRRGAKGPFVLVTERRLVANAAAHRLVGPEDEAALRDAADVLRTGRAGDVLTLVVRGGTAAVRAQRPPDDGSPSGIVLKLTSLARPESTGTGRRGDPDGWEDLTDTERSVAQLVAEGHTNREAAERLFLSPHTVDFHLRAVFRKLGTSSRVHLARLVVLTQQEREGA
jgi:DNA-binding CsgD family transcriptional regulator